MVEEGRLVGAGAGEVGVIGMRKWERDGCVCFFKLSSSGAQQSHETITVLRSEKNVRSVIRKVIWRVA